MSGEADLMRAALGPMLTWQASDLDELEVLTPCSLEFVRALWDVYDGCNSPLGISGEVIHYELNRRGDGWYCAV